MPLACGGLDVHQPRMRVLRVEDGVFFALRDRQLEVELDGGVRRAQKIEVAHGVRANTIDQLVESDETAGPLRHLALLQIDHLMKDNDQLLWIEAQGRHRSLHARHVAMMVRAPDLDDTIEAAVLETAQ